MPATSAMFSDSVSLPLTWLPGQRLVGVVLRRQALGRGLEVLHVLVRPPVGETAAGVELGALIVEAVADLVADDDADAAVVLRRIGPGIEERRLQDRGGEVHRVLQRQVHRVDRLRRHPPLGLVHRLGELGERRRVVEELRARGVAEGVVARHGEAAVVAPAVGIADADVERVELRLRLGARRRRHPLQVVDPLAESERRCSAPSSAPRPWPPAGSTSRRRACRPPRRARRWSRRRRASSGRAAGWRRRARCRRRRTSGRRTPSRAAARRGRRCGRRGSPARRRAAPRRPGRRCR